MIGIPDVLLQTLACIGAAVVIVAFISTLYAGISRLVRGRQPLSPPKSDLEVFAHVADGRLSPLRGVIWLAARLRVAKMADFCKRCSISNFGHDYGDLGSITDAAAWAEGRAAVVNCEGCGAIQVAPDGTCLSETCLEKHGLTDEARALAATVKFHGERIH